MVILLLLNIFRRGNLKEFTETRGIEKITVNTNQNNNNNILNDYCIKVSQLSTDKTKYR